MDPSPVPFSRHAFAHRFNRQQMQGAPPLAQHAPVRPPREASPMPWPDELLEAFSLRMARHGMSISRSLMLRDKAYALQQLVHGQGMGDEALRLMAAQLFRHFEACQSGIAPLH